MNVLQRMWLGISQEMLMCWSILLLLYQYLFTESDWYMLWNFDTIVVQFTLCPYTFSVFMCKWAKTFFETVQCHVCVLIKYWIFHCIIFSIIIKTVTINAVLLQYNVFFLIKTPHLNAFKSCSLQVGIVTACLCIMSNCNVCKTDCWYL